MTKYVLVLDVILFIYCTKSLTMVLSLFLNHFFFFHTFIGIFFFHDYDIMIEFILQLTVYAKQRESYLAITIFTNQEIGYINTLS